MVYVAGRLKVIEDSMDDPESARQAAQLVPATRVCESTNILQAATQSHSLPWFQGDIPTLKFCICKLFASDSIQHVKQNLLYRRSVRRVFS